MTNKKLSKVYSVLEESKKIDTDLNEIELNYDVVKEEILDIYSEFPTITEAEAVEVLFTRIKKDLGLIEEEVVVDEREPLEVSVVFEQLISYLNEDESFAGTMLEEELIREELEVMIHNNPEDSKETIAWIMKDKMKQEIKF